MPSNIMDEARATYLKQIETTFIRLRGRGLMLSPKDVALIERWRNAGVPSHVVLRALEGAAKEYLNRHPPSSPLPSTLGYFERRIDDAVKLWRGRMLDWEEAETIENANVEVEQVPREQLEALILVIEEAGQRVDDEVVRASLRQTWRALQDALTTDVKGVWALAAELDEALMTQILDGVPSACREELVATAEERIASTFKTISADARKNRLSYELATVIRKRWELPELVEVMRERG